MYGGENQGSRTEADPKVTFIIRNKYNSEPTPSDSVITKGTKETINDIFGTLLPKYEITNFDYYVVDGRDLGPKRDNYNYINIDLCQKSKSNACVTFAIYYNDSNDLADITVLHRNLNYKDTRDDIPLFNAIRDDKGIQTALGIIVKEAHALHKELLNPSASVATTPSLPKQTNMRPTPFTPTNVPRSSVAARAAMIDRPKPSPSVANSRPVVSGSVSGSVAARAAMFGPKTPIPVAKSLMPVTPTSVGSLSQVLPRSPGARNLTGSNPVSALATSLKPTNARPGLSVVERAKIFGNTSPVVTAPASAPLKPTNASRRNMMTPSLAVGGPKLSGTPSPVDNLSHASSVFVSDEVNAMLNEMTPEVANLIKDEAVKKYETYVTENFMESKSYIPSDPTNKIKLAIDATFALYYNIKFRYIIDKHLFLERASSENDILEIILKKNMGSNIGAVYTLTIKKEDITVNPTSDIVINNFKNKYSEGLQALLQKAIIYSESNKSIYADKLKVLSEQFKEFVEKKKASKPKMGGRRSRRKGRKSHKNRKSHKKSHKKSRKSQRRQ